MAWRLARSLEQLRSEVDARWPRRDRRSDGTIGDAAHSSRYSDHNPNAAGVVCAIDITHDPKGGVGAGKLAELFRARSLEGDRRVKYVIWDRKIFNPSINHHWRHYSGVNPHTQHVHLSVHGPYDNTADWFDTPLEEDDVLKRNQQGAYVKELQNTLNTAVKQGVFGREPNWYPLAVDGDYGPSTSWAVKTAKQAVYYRAGDGDDAHPNFVSRLEAYSRPGVRLEDDDQ